MNQLSLKKTSIQFWTSLIIPIKKEKIKIKQFSGSISAGLKREIFFFDTLYSYVKTSSLWISLLCFGSFKFQEIRNVIYLSGIE